MDRLNGEEPCWFENITNSSVYGFILPLDWGVGVWLTWAQINSSLWAMTDIRIFDDDCSLVFLHWENWKTSVWLSVLCLWNAYFFPFCCTWKPLAPLIKMLTFSQSMEDNIFISCSFESMRYPGLQKNKMDKQTLTWCKSTSTDLIVLFMSLFLIWDFNIT